MKFCEQCENMYYISIDPEDPNKLIYYCRNCQYKDRAISEEGVCVINTHVKKTQQQFSHVVNEFTKLDPTLPRIYNMVCPNGSCDTNQDEHKGATEIIYIRYDHDNLKYMYICSHCNKTWKTDEKN
uniref:DNA-directed RNA polymerase II subunit RPB9-like zinc ribbon domain-containing protein n=1 Tax=viral metagenome TaxID=1070528 RepID=A0A6C0I410_9ZZZZ